VGQSRAKNENIFEVKNQKRDAKKQNPCQVVFCFFISFQVFNYENILSLGDSKVGSHL
jgi:hypothetical protein